MFGGVIYSFTQLGGADELPNLEAMIRKKLGGKADDATVKLYAAALHPLLQLRLHMLKSFEVCSSLVDDKLAQEVCSAS